MISRNTCLGIARKGLALLAMVAVSACRLASPAPTATPVPTSTQPASTAIPTLPPTPTLPPDWTPVAAGVELRGLSIPAEDKSDAAWAVLLRVDLARADLRVRYDPGEPETVVGWAERTGAPAVINAGFFQKDYSPAGLLSADGQRYGLSFDETGPTPGASEGMFSVVGGAAYIRALSGAAYDPAEPLDQAVQGLPMLIDGGAPVDFSLPDRAALRTAVALDAGGRLVLVHVSGGQITLPRLRDWLLGQPDLGLVSALNLDGGTSTGMVVNTGPWRVRNNSVNKVPSVIEVISH